MVLQKKIFKGFHHIWTGLQSWSMDRDHFSNLLYLRLKEAPHEIGPAASEEKWFEILNIFSLQMYGVHSNARGSKTDLAVKRSNIKLTYDHHFSCFGRPPIPGNVCKDSAPRHPRFWRRFSKVFTIYANGGHLGQQTATILALLFPQPEEAPSEIWVKLAQRLQRGSRLKMLTDRWTSVPADGWRTKSDHYSLLWA